jgi:hypothetical protein
MACTADDLAAAIRDRSEAVLVRRPDAKNWAAKEVICHLRDTEELFRARFDMIASLEEPRFPTLNPDVPDRWAEDRQYIRNDAGGALATFRTRREESLAYLRALTPEQWLRGGLHPTRGRMTPGDFVTLIAWHDENHFDQLRRALDGKV